MKPTFIFCMIIGLISIAYFSAQSKIQKPLDVKDLRLGMTLRELEKAFGAPSDRNRNQITYVLPDSSQLIISLRDEEVSSAQLKYHRPIKIGDPQMRLLTLVQMNSDVNQGSHPSWFFAGKPEEGLIYKITAEGVVESLTWVPPFTYVGNQPKRLQALLRDFKGQNWSKL